MRGPPAEEDAAVAKVSDTGSKKIPEGADISGNRGYRKIPAGNRPNISARIQDLNLKYRIFLKFKFFEHKFVSNLTNPRFFIRDMQIPGGTEKSGYRGIPRNSGR